MNIPVNTPLLDESDKSALIKCIDSGWISSEGPLIAEFEERFAKYIGREHAIACSSGSAALDIACAAIGLKDDDEVIMPTFTIISPALSVIRMRALPVLVDCNEETWNIDVFQIEAKITSKTKAIIVVHIYGFPVDMNPVVELCKRYNLLLIEDAAEMHGQTYYDNKCGSFGDISIFSFYPNKHITTGEGGMILTNSDFFASRSKKLRNLAFEPNLRRFVHEEMGWNYRMTSLQAALGISQLNKIDQHIKRKREIGKKYQKLLSGLPYFSLPIDELNFSTNIYWVFPLVAENEIIAEKVVEYLNSNGVGTRPFFWPIHEQPVFNKIGLFVNQSFPKAEKASRCGFYLPSGLALNDDEIEYVCKIVWQSISTL